jgi:GrpB-like predicted nucleotidyltransferase (UPF0157 family)
MVLNLSTSSHLLSKYPLLFRELLKATPDTHPDYPNVQQTLQKLEQIAVDVNQYKDNAESFRKFLGTEFDIKSIHSCRVS